MRASAAPSRPARDCPRVPAGPALNSAPARPLLSVVCCLPMDLAINERALFAPPSTRASGPLQVARRWTVRG